MNKQLYLNIFHLITCLSLVTLSIYAQSKIDNNPDYRPALKMYKIDKVEYQNDETIIHFTFNCTNSIYSGASFFEVNSANAWFLKDAKTGITYHASSIEKIYQDGELLTNQLQETQTYWANFGKKKTSYSCEIHFNNLPKTLRKADLIEGINQAARKDRFNVYDIAFSPKAESTEVLSKELVLVEEGAIKEENNSNVSPNTNNPLEAVVRLDWKAFPNPIENLLNIELEKTKDIQIKIMAQNGQILLQKTSSQRLTQIDLSHFPAGAYIVNVSTKEASTAKQIIIR